MRIPLFLIYLITWSWGCMPADSALDDFFSLHSVHRIDIQVDSLAYDSLLEQPREYVPARVEIDGSVYENVGVRLKGRAGSFVGLDGDYSEFGHRNGKPGKSAFIIDFNRFVAKTNHLDLKKLTLNNMAQDPTYLVEFLGYSVFRMANAPASRTGYATVVFNATQKGLYALIETPDNDEFLSFWFGTDQVELYEGEVGTDLRDGLTGFYDHDHGQDTEKQHLQNLVEALDSADPGADPLELLERHFDLEQYLKFAAAEIIIGHWDGYLHRTNNYFILYHPETDRFCFIPWGIDQSFRDGMDQFGCLEQGCPSWGPGRSRIHQICWTSPTCRERLSSAISDLLDRTDQWDLPGLAKDALDLIGDHVQAETIQPEATLQSQQQLTSYLDQRRPTMEEWPPCPAD